MTGGRLPAPLRRRRWLLAELALPALAAAALAWALWGRSYDDAFITYRFADNWAHGRGLTFNPGETLLGTTAPGWALALGVLARASAALGLGGLGVPQWGTLLSLAALWWLAAALPALWLPEDSALRPALPLALGALALTARWNLELLGAEAFAATAFAATAVWLATRRGDAGGEIAAGLCAAAAMLCRLDAALAAGAVGLGLWLRHRRFPRRFAAAGLLPLVPYLGWLWLRFGTVLPNTLAGKRSEAAAEIAYSAAEWGWLGRSWGGAGRSALLVLALAGLALLTSSLRRGGGRRPPSGRGAALAVIAAWVLAHEVFYRLAGVPFAPWYQVLTVNAALALAAYAAARLAAAGSAALAGPGRLSPAGGRAVAAAVSLLLSLPLLIPGVRFLATTASAPPDPRTRLYSAVGRYLAEGTPPDAVVASMEVGALAYAGDRPVLDLVGLVSPGVVDARNAGRLPAFVAAAAPEHILVPPPFLGRELGEVMRHPEIRRRYRPVARFFDPAYEHDPVTLYRRR